LNYNLQYHPLETMSFSVSLTQYWGLIQTHDAQENTSVLTQFHGSLLPALNMSSEVGFNRNIQLLETKQFDTWNYQISFDGDVSQRLGALVSYAYRNSKEVYSGMQIAQNRISGNLTLRLTQTILVTGEADLVEDGSFYVNQQYNLNWHILPKVSLGGQSSFSSTQNGDGNERYAFYLNYEFARNGTLFCQYNKIQDGGQNAERTLSTQIGIHMGF